MLNIHHQIGKMYDVMKKQEKQQKNVPHYTDQGIIFLSFDDVKILIK